MRPNASILILLFKNLFKALLIFINFSYRMEVSGQMVFMSVDSIFQLLEIFTGCRFIPLSSIEWIIIEAIN